MIAISVFMVMIIDYVLPLQCVKSLQSSQSRATPSKSPSVPATPLKHVPLPQLGSLPVVTSPAFNPANTIGLLRYGACDGAEIGSYLGLPMWA